LTQFLPLGYFLVKEHCTESRAEYGVTFVTSTGQRADYSLFHYTTSIPFPSQAIWPRRPDLEMKVSLNVVLAIGLDASLLRDLSGVWQSEGYIVTSTASIRDAITHYHAGDFDLVLLGHSIPAEERERLTFLIRASGSLVPIVSIENYPTDCNKFADATHMKVSSELFAAMGALIAKRMQFPVLPVIAYGDAP
jgi:hypothetical protein